MNFYELDTTGMSIEEVENALSYQDDELDSKIEELVNSVRFPVLLRGGTSCDDASEYEAHVRMLAAEQRAEILAEVANVIDVEVTYGGETKTADGRPVFNAPEYTAVTGEVESEDYGRYQYVISYHQGRMPAFDTETFDTLSELVQAMIKIAPISQWSEIEYE